MDRRKVIRQIRKDEKASMGVGTLITFIALILVAAVASMVIITTVDQLKMKAFHTGLIAKEDVSTGFNVITVLGDRGIIGTNATMWGPAGNRSTNQASTIQTLMLKVKLRAGSEPIRMDRTIIDVSDGFKSLSLSFNANSTDNWSHHAGEDPNHLEGNNAWDYQDGCMPYGDTVVLSYRFTCQLLMDPTEHASFLDRSIITSGTLINIFINANTTGLTLENQGHLTIKLIPKHGVPTLIDVTMPSTYVDRFSTIL